jgi:hypothetical protein
MRKRVTGTCGLEAVAAAARMKWIAASRSMA